MSAASRRRWPWVLVGVLILGAGVVAGALLLGGGSSEPPGETASRTDVDVRAFGAMGDGNSDDTEAVQRALDSIGTAGGTVRFPAGVYKVTKPLAPKSGSLLAGAGAPETVVKGGDIFTPVLDLTDRSHIVVERLTVTYDSNAWDTPRSSAPIVSDARRGGETTDITFRDNIIRDTPKQALVARGEDRETGPKRWTLVGNQFLRSGRGSAIFFNADAITVADNSFEDSGDDAIAFNGATQHSVAERNTIVRAGSILGQGAGVKVHGQHNIIRDNRVEGFVNAGVFLKKANPTGYAGPADNQILNNTLIGTIDIEKKANQAGIQILDVEGTTTVVGNQIHAQSGSENYEGIRVETSPDGHIVIRDNRVVTNLPGANGIPALDATSSVRMLEVVGNTFESLGDGILLSSETGGGDVTVTRNTFAGSGTEAVIRVRPASVGLGVLRVLDNSSVQPGVFINLANRPAKMVEVRGNTIGSASLLQGTGGVGVLETG